jgi:hypothetical protein
VDLGQAQILRDKVQALLDGYKSYAKISPGSRNNFHVVVHKHDSVLPELPIDVKIVQGGPLNEMKNPTRNPVPSSGKDLDLPRKPGNQATEPTDEFRWRNRGLQDIVKRIAMKSELQKKLAAVANQLEKLAAERDATIDSALEVVQKSLLHNAYKSTNPLWRLLVKVQKSYDPDLAQDLVESLVKAKFEASDPTLLAAKHALSLIQKHPGMLSSPKDLEQSRVADQTASYLADLEKICTKISTSLNKLDLKEESQQMKAMAASAKDIYARVKKISD